jgi:hypothetical protein
VVMSAYKTEDPEFVYRQGVGFLGIYTLQCCRHNLKCIVIVCTGEKINDLKNLLKNRSCSLIVSGPG